MSIKGQHRGHCQACGRTQVTDGLLAKHGYRVAGFGYFNGVCFGSNHKPLEQERKLTDEIIADLRAQAQHNEVRAIALGAGSLKPLRATKRWDHGGIVYATLHGESGPIMVEWSEASAFERKLQVESDIQSAESFARFARAHAASLTELADKVHGQPLIDRAQAELDKVVAYKAKHAPIDGAYRSKAEQKRALEMVSREYSTLREAIANRYLHDRGDAGREVYWALPFDLHAWRPATSAKVLAVYPELSGTVAAIEFAWGRRSEIKARPVIK
jgi:hypothetical protein